MGCFYDLENIVDFCTQGNSGGYTGRVWVFPSSAYCDFGDNAVVGIYRVNSEITAPYVHCYDMNLIDALSGTTLAGDTDSGRRMFKKTITLRIQARTADAVEKVLMPLITNRNGFIFVAERKAKGDYLTYRVFGSQDKCVADVASITQSEYENGGDWIVPFTCVESKSDVVFCHGDTFTYKDTKTWLETKCQTS